MGLRKIGYNMHKMSTSQEVDQWFSTLSESAKESISSISISAIDPTFLVLTQSPLAVLIVIKDTIDCSAIIHSLSQSNFSFYPYIITSDEAETMSTIHPVDFFLFRTFYTPFYGEDFLASAVLLRDNHFNATNQELQRLIIQFRSSCVELTHKNYLSLLQGTITRLYPILISLLSLDAAPIAVQLSQTIASIESRCGVKSFVLSKVITILESKKLPKEESLETLFVDIQNSLDLISQTLTYRG